MTQDKEPYQYGSYDACLDKKDGLPCPKYKQSMSQWCKNCQAEEEEIGSCLVSEYLGDPGPDPNDYYHIGDDYDD